jgi:alanine dehydrogenase
MAIGLGAEVIVLNPFIQDLDRLKTEFGESIQVFESTTENIEHHLFEADLVIGAVLVPGANAPKLVTKAHLKQMKIGAVLVDVAIDQGGCFETSRPTTHENPVYTIDGIIHYCVANIPGAVPRTATLALNNATLPYILNLANKGYQEALLEDAGFLKGLNVMQGQITYQPVAASHGLDYVNPLKLLK